MDTELFDADRQTERWKNRHDEAKGSATQKAGCRGGQRSLPAAGRRSNLLCKTASSPSNRRRADAADQSRSRRAADICVLETDLPGGQCGMAEEFTEKLI